MEDHNVVVGEVDGQTVLRFKDGEVDVGFSFPADELLAALMDGSPAFTEAVGETTRKILLAYVARQDATRPAD